MEDKMPVSRSILWILLSTLFISGSVLMGWLYYLHMRDMRLHDDQYRIVAIIQKCPQADVLKTVYLAELLGLSLDQPINLYQFNTKEATQTLLNHPLIKEATIKKILPGTLYIEYLIRTPVAFVGDFANTAVDEEGILFPFSPFFTPKRLPKIYFGLHGENCQWGSCLKSFPSFNTAFELIKQFTCIEQEHFELKTLDVTQIQADSYGVRESVMVLEKNNSPSPTRIILRLSAEHTEQNLVNFRTLQAMLLERKEKGFEENQSMIIDFRMQHLAFIKKEV